MGPVSYRNGYSKTFRVVGCEIQPASIHKTKLNLKDDVCMSTQGDPQEAFQEIKSNEDNEIYFTYTVKWKESNVCMNEKSNGSTFNMLCLHK